MTVREVLILETNRKYLVEHLRPQPLLDKLHAAKVISSKQKDFVSAKVGLREKNEAILEVLNRGSLDSYRKTVECLCSSSQCEIAQILGQGVAQQNQGRFGNSTSV